MDDGGGPDRDHRGGHEVERADVVERPAREPDVVAREPELGDVRVVLPREIGVRDHYALRATRRARRVHQTVEVVAGYGRARRGVARGQVGEAVPARNARPGDADAREVGQAAGGVVGEVDELGVADEGACLRVLEDEPELGRGEAPVDRHRDRAEVVGREDRREELDAVVGEQADDVARADVARLQPAGERGRPFRHLLIGDGRVAADRDRLVGRTARVVLEHGQPTHVGLHPRGRLPAHGAA